MNEKRKELVYVKGDHIYFYDEINTENVLIFNMLFQEMSLNHLSSTVTSMHQVTEPPAIWIHLNTPGGSVVEGLNMYDNIKRIAEVVPVYIIVEGQASSMGAVITQAATQSFIRKNSFMLVHQISSKIYGTMSNLEDGFKNSKMFYKKLIKILKKETKFPQNILDDLLKKDIFLTAKQCKKYGLVDEIM